MTDRTELPPADPTRPPYERLLPVALALLAHGATQTRRGLPGVPFGPSPAGYEAHFAEPLDLAWIQERFVLPAAVRYDPQRDELLDTETFTAIYGSRPAA